MIHFPDFLSEQLPNLCTSVTRSYLAAVTSLIQTSLISLPTPSSSLQASRINYYPTMFHQFESLSRLQAGDDARGLVIRKQ